MYTSTFTPASHSAVLYLRPLHRFRLGTLYEACNRVETEGGKCDLRLAEPGTHLPHYPKVSPRRGEVPSAAN